VIVRYYCICGRKKGDPQKSPNQMGAMGQRMNGNAIYGASLFSQHQCCPIRPLLGGRPKPIPALVVAPAMLTK